jgi:hypothetical protein
MATCCLTPESVEELARACQHVENCLRGKCQVVDVIGGDNLGEDILELRDRNQVLEYIGRVSRHGDVVIWFKYLMNGSQSVIDE